MPELAPEYIICYGNVRLYNAPRFGTLAERGHPLNVRSYFDLPFFDFRSVKYLQTLPSGNDIIIYSYNGQLSACITAYLKILGYRVKTLLFGANSLIYSRMIDDPNLMPFTFTTSDIMNFDYVRGNQ